MELKYNAASKGGHILYEDNDIVEVPIVVMKETVTTGNDGIATFKPYENFKDDAHWLTGMPVLKGHTRPDEIVTYKHKRIGQILNVRARDDKRDVVGKVRYFKKDLTPEEIARIKGPDSFDASIAYTTDTVPSDGEFHGQKYNAIEGTSKRWHFYHVAELDKGKGACSECGIKLNSIHSIDCNEYNEPNGVDKLSDKIDPTLTDTKQNAADAEDDMIEDEESSEAGKTDKTAVCKKNKSSAKCKKLMEADKEMTEEVKENSVPSNETITLEAVLDTDAVVKLNETIELLGAEVKTLAGHVNTLMTERESFVQKQNAAKEDADKTAFGMRLNAAARVKLDEHWTGFKSEGFAYLNAHPEIESRADVKQNAGLQGSAHLTPGVSLAEARAQLVKTQREKHKIV